MHPHPGLRFRLALSSAFLLFGLFSGFAAAQVLEMGNEITSPNAADDLTAEVRTDIDLVTPATATGSIDSATRSCRPRDCSTRRSFRCSKSGPFRTLAAGTCRTT